MKYFVMALVVIPMSIIIGCAGTSPRREVDLPKWWANVPQDSEFHYERGDGLGTINDNAEEKARLAAKARLSEWRKQRVNSFIEDIQKELGPAKSATHHASFERVRTSIAEQTIMGVEPAPGYYKAYMEGELYHVYLLMRAPFESMLDQIQKTMLHEQELYEEFVATKVRERFKEELEGYRQQEKTK